MRRAAGFALLVGFTLVAAAPDAHAQLGPGILNSLPDAFVSTTRSWEGGLGRVGQWTFLGLAVIQLSIAVAQGQWEGASLFQIMGIITRNVLACSFFWWLLIQGPENTRAIIDGFAYAAGMATGNGATRLTPTDVAEAGLNLAKTLWKSMDWWTSPSFSLLLLLAGFGMLYAFIEVVGAMVLVIIDGYFFAATAALMMGFGGSSYTRDIAIAQLRAAAAIGAKRLILVLLVGVAQGVIVGWANGLRNATLTYDNVAPMIMAPFIFYKLCLSLPARAEGLVSGQGATSTERTGSALQQAAKNLAQAGAALGGAAAAVSAAYQLAAAQNASSQNAGSSGGEAAQGGGRGIGGSVASALGRAASLTGAAAKNLGAAAASDVGKRLTGNYAAQHGHTSWRMAQSLSDQRRALADAGQQRGAPSQQQNQAPAPTRAPASM